MNVPEKAEAKQSVCNDGVAPDTKAANAQLFEENATAFMKPVGSIEISVINVNSYTK
jgi:hypothetical protein